MNQKRKRRKPRTDDRVRDARESGEPGGGAGRRDEVGRSGVYPAGADDIPPDAEIRMAGSWGGGSYEEAGGSELVFRDGVLLGGLTAGPAGEPTIDTHGGDASSREAPPRDAADAGDTDAAPAADGPADAVNHFDLLLRGLPPGATGDRDAARREDTGRQE